HARRPGHDAPPAPSGDPGVEAGAVLGHRTVGTAHEASDVDAGDAGLEASAGLTLHDNGLAATGSTSASAHTDNEEGLTAQAGLDVGAGLAAFADVRDLPDGRAHIALTVEASARLGGTAGYAQDDQGGT